jgi:hypothetical protein
MYVTKDRYYHSRQILLREKLSAIYNEILTVWFEEPWLHFTDDHRQIFLTVDNNSNNHCFLTVQNAIDLFRSNHRDRFLVYQPECLLVKVIQRTNTLFIPNRHVTLQEFYRTIHNDDYYSYRLLAVLCCTKHGQNTLMFYKDVPSNSWQIYCRPDDTVDCSTSLSDDEHDQLELFVSQANRLNLADVFVGDSARLMALYNYPIVFVYLPIITKNEHQRLK